MDIKAVWYRRYGGPEVLEIFDLPEIHAGPGHVRIRNHAASVDPTDILARSGMLSEQQQGIAPACGPSEHVSTKGLTYRLGSTIAGDSEEFSSPRNVNRQAYAVRRYGIEYRRGSHYLEAAWKAQSCAH